MVSEKKKLILQELKKEIASHKVVGIVDLNKLPAKQLLDIRGSLKGAAKIRMTKKRVIGLALKESKLDALHEYKPIMPALLFSNENPFKLANLIADSKSSAPAKQGDVLNKDVVIPAGVTSVAAGPAIGDFQKLKIPVGVENAKIAVKKETKVASKGDVVSKELSGLMQKLSINPMEIGLNLMAASEGGTVYASDILFIPASHYLDQIKSGYSNAFALTLGIGYVTKDNIRLLLGKASRQAKCLALDRGFVTDETLKPLLAKGMREAEALKSKVPEPTASVSEEKAEVSQ